MPYKKHFLTDVILRIDFSSPIDAIKNNLSEKLKTVCIELFPIFEEKQMNTQQVTVEQSPGSQNTKINYEQFTDWHFFGKSREKELYISNSYLFVNFKKYLTFDDLLHQFSQILDCFAREYIEMKIYRVGLRYIDQIDLPLKSKKNWYNYWEKYLSSNLLKSLQFVDNNDAIARYMSTIEMNYGDYMLRFRYGIFNEDYPAPNKKNKFVLDTDVYAIGPFDVDDISSKVQSFHSRIKDWFEKSIKTELRNIMGVIEDEK